MERSAASLCGLLPTTRWSCGAVQRDQPWHEALVFRDACPRASGLGCARRFRRASSRGRQIRLRERGFVECGPSDLKGKTVFVLHPHQTRYVVPASAVHVLPAEVPPARAVLAANLETALNGVWDARPHVGDRVVVIGAGTVGCLVAWLAARIPGCDVQLVDVNPQRQRVAQATRCFVRAT